MSDFTISAGRNTPSVVYESKKGLLIISGKSYPEDSRSFYTDLTTRLCQMESGISFIVILDFEYLSSSSVACLLQMLKDLKAHFVSGKITVELFADAGDDEMISVGDNFKQLSGLPVQIKIR